MTISIKMINQECLLFWIQWYLGKVKGNKQKRKYWKTGFKCSASFIWGIYTIYNHSKLLPHNIRRSLKDLKNRWILGIDSYSCITNKNQPRDKLWHIQMEVNYELADSEGKKYLTIGDSKVICCNFLNCPRNKHLLHHTGTGRTTDLIRTSCFITTVSLCSSRTKVSKTLWLQCRVGITKTFSD